MQFYVQVRRKRKKEGKKKRKYDGDNGQNLDILSGQNHKRMKVGRRIEQTRNYYKNVTVTKSIII